jgi:hypothetical protein
MSYHPKNRAWIISLVVLVLITGIPGLILWGRQKPISLTGAVLVQDEDSWKQVPIAGVAVSADSLAAADSTSGPSGLFVLNLHKLVRRGHPITLHFRHPQYHPLDLHDFVSNKIYVVHLVPLSNSAATINQAAQVQVTNIRVRYTVRSMTELNVGSAVKTFQVENRGNVPCNGGHPCSPDGKWKAALGSAALDAGAGNEIRDARASCIAGPCPFTRIDGDHSSPGGHVMTVSARDWSDTATFLLEAEVFHPMQIQSEHWSYPVIFGESLSFTLPSAAESVSIEADLDGQTIIFPIGPALFLSWAACNTAVNPDHGRVYGCTPKPGFRFQ